LVWLKRPGNPDDQAELVDLGRELRVIPGIRFLDSGTALPSERTTMDDSFLLVFTDDQQADTIHALGNPHIRTPHINRLSCSRA
jgi:hypothetical protein